jgi:hypothetical protein
MTVAGALGNMHTSRGQGDIVGLPSYRLTRHLASRGVSKWRFI